MPVAEVVTLVGPALGEPEPIESNGKPEREGPDGKFYYGGKNGGEGRPKGSTYRNIEFVEKKAEGMDREYVRKYTRARLPDVLKEAWDMIMDPDTPKNTKASLIETWMEYAIDKPRQQGPDEEGHQPLALNPLPEVE